VTTRSLGLVFACTCVAVTTLSCEPRASVSPRPSETVSRQPATLIDLDGHTHTFFDARNQQVIVMLFVAPDCPIANGYAPEINRLVSAYSPRGAAFYIIYPDSDVSPEQARRHASDFGFTCPVALDPQNDWARQAGATVTPEAAVWGRDGTLFYRGRIDDQYVAFGRKRFAATTHDLRDALEAATNVPQAGENPAPPSSRITQAIGCPIAG
jgi:hypothetical protein